jgi:hypothetical protein
MGHPSKNHVPIIILSILQFAKFYNKIKSKWVKGRDGPLGSEERWSGLFIKFFTWQEDCQSHLFVGFKEQTFWQKIYCPNVNCVAVCYLIDGIVKSASYESIVCWHQFHRLLRFFLYWTYEIEMTTY